MNTSPPPAGTTGSAFTFETTPRIICRDRAAGELGTLADEYGMTRVLIVTDRGVQLSGALTEALESLETAGIAVSLFADVLPDPPEHTVLAAVGFARDQDVDGVIGIGGGSSLDTAKLVALLARSSNVLREIYGVERARGKRLPLIQVPTTGGTGSEVTPIAIVTTATNEKQGVVSRLLFPDVAVLDATLTLGLPARATAMTGIDAMVHAIEAYTTRHRKNPLSDSLAIRALQLLSANLPVAVQDGSNLPARRALLQGAMLAGMAFANAPVGAVHALAYPLGGHFHVPHGLSNALVLLPVLRFNLPVAASQYAELAPHILVGGSEPPLPADAEAFIEAMAQLVAGLGLERTLGAVGVQATDLELLATDAMKVQRLLVNNAREVTYDDALAIYESVL